MANHAGVTGQFNNQRDAAAMQLASSGKRAGRVVKRARAFEQLTQHRQVARACNQIGAPDSRFLETAGQRLVQRYLLR